MALIVPELIAAWAIRQWLSARILTTRFKASGHFKFHHPQERPDSEWCSLDLCMHDTIRYTSLDVERADSEAPAEQYEVGGELGSCILSISLDGLSTS